MHKILESSKSRGPNSRSIADVFAFGPLPGYLTGLVFWLRMDSFADMRLFVRAFWTLRKEILIYVLPFTLLLGCGAEAPTRVKLSVSDTSMICSLCDLDKAWVKKDTNKVLNFIDTLHNMPQKEFIPNIYHFSEVSGFGIALIDYADSNYYKPNKRNHIFRSNLLALLDAYVVSEYFMRAPCEVILVHTQYNVRCDEYITAIEAKNVVLKVFEPIDCFEN